MYEFTIIFKDEPNQQYIFFGYNQKDMERRNPELKERPYSVFRADYID